MNSLLSEYKTHLFSYRYQGAEWHLEIKATDAHDAKERMKALAFARYDGVSVLKIQIVPNWFMRLIGLLKTAKQNIKKVIRD